MVKTFRDAEIQIEDLRDRLNRLKSETSSEVTEEFVKKEINTAIKRIKIPTPVVEQSNIFPEIFIRRYISGSKQPMLTIDSFNDTKIRLTRVVDADRFDILLNQYYTGAAWVQDDATVGSLSLRMDVGATDADCIFRFLKTSAGSSTRKSLLTITGDGNLYPDDTGVVNFGKSTNRWNAIFAESIDLTDPVLVEDGGTGRSSFTTNDVVLGNGTSALGNITGSSTDVEVVTNASVSYSTGDHEGITYVSDVSLSQTKVTLNFTYGVFVGTT